ncbi:MAG: bifunctional adenosylcobinamide kinase/adenosylcobinamide-phosphate guanylyltransferase [Alphaproteobacteria bacterium]
MSAAPALPPVTLVLGGAASGKSRYAQGLVEQAALARIYLATAEAGDAEMAERIRRHQALRGAGWRTVEVPLELVPALDRYAAADAAVLVDCLTLWLSNLLGAGRDAEAETDALLAVLPRLRGPVVFVSNEVGLGIVPENALARRFRDCAGRLHASLAAAAEAVAFMVAGLPIQLKTPQAPGSPA